MKEMLEILMDAIGGLSILTIASIIVLVIAYYVFYV